MGGLLSPPKSHGTSFSCRCSLTISCLLFFIREQICINSQLAKHMFSNVYGIECSNLWAGAMVQDCCKLGLRRQKSTVSEFSSCLNDCGCSRPKMFSVGVGVETQTYIMYPDAMPYVLFTSYQIVYTRKLTT